MKEEQVIFKGVAGSHLFGTNTPNSDYDYKGIYLPPAEDIVFQQVKESIEIKTNSTNQKNTKEDVDTSYYSLCKFFKLLEKGETVGLEMLFTPPDMVITSSPLWVKIQSNKEHFLHKGTLAFIGYARTQANKYGIKGSRMGAVKLVMSLLKNFSGTIRLFQIQDHLNSVIDETLIRYSITFDQRNLPITYFEVCGRKFDMQLTIEEVHSALNKIYNNYGARAKLAQSNEGIDWKAVSHAFRVCFQGQQLFKDHWITLPLASDHRDLVLQIKRGELNFDFVSNLLDTEMNKLIELSEKSTLPNSLRKDIVNELIFNEYGKIIESQLHQ